MANFNSVVIVGRVNRDPELRYSPSGAPICSFSVSTSRRITNDAGEKIEQVTILDVETWRRLAETSAQFLKKGREVLVMGTLRQSRSTHPKTKEPQAKIKIVAQVVQFLGSFRDMGDLPVEEDPEDLR